MGGRGAANGDGGDDEKVSRSPLVVDGVFQAIGAPPIAASLLFADRGNRNGTTGMPEMASVRFNYGGYGVATQGRL